MRLSQPRLTQARRAGLLASVAVYPLSRLAGTLPRPALDRAVVSGVTMAVAYQTAAASTAAIRGAAGLGIANPRARAASTAGAAFTLMTFAALIAQRGRSESQRLAREGRRLSVPAAALGSGAELAMVGAGAGALVALADTVGMTLPEPLRPTHPAVVTTGLVAVGGALGAAARHPRLLSHLQVEASDGGPAEVPVFQEGATLPMAVARSAGVAGVTVLVLALEDKAAERIAHLLGGAHPGLVARAVGHGVLGLGVVAAGLAGFTFYSSRVVVEEKLLEAAFAAVPARHGVSGGPDSEFEFEDLGREGRRFVSQAHSAEELIAVLAQAATDPVRAFVPLSALSNDAETDASVVVAELERLGGFAKGHIVLSAPTGDGYVSYVHTETVEMLTCGDCATVAVAYANVPSAIAFPRRHSAAAAYAAYARAIADRARELNPDARLFTFGESLGSIVALDAFGPDIVMELEETGFDGGLYVGVPIFSRTDKALRPNHPRKRQQAGLQYANTREQALSAHPGYVNLSHPTDPVAVADPSVIVRHHVDYWGRPFGVHVPLVSFLVHLADVKNAMNLRPGEFTPSPGHDYRYETAAGVARAYDLPFDLEAVVEAALRERELAWSVRRLLSKQIAAARDTAVSKLRSWGVDPADLSSRFNIPESSLPDWLVSDPHAMTDDDLPQI